MAKVAIDFAQHANKEKAVTKGTVRYQEVGDSANLKVGALYVKKGTFGKMSDNPEDYPAKIKVTVEY